jgi:hypothetical protein
MIGKSVRISNWKGVYIIVDKILVDGNTRYICRESGKHDLHIVHASLITELYNI